MIKETNSQAQSTLRTDVADGWNGSFLRGCFGRAASKGRLDHRTKQGAKRLCVAGLIVSLTLAQGPGASAQVVLDVTRTAVVGSGRVVGMGGAYTGIGEGVQGYFRNPASLANRSSYASDWYEWDVSVDWSLHAGQELDLDNDGRLGDERLEYWNYKLGLGAQWGRFGLGLNGEPSKFITSSTTDDLKPMELRSTRNVWGLG